MEGHAAGRAAKRRAAQRMGAGRQQESDAQALTVKRVGSRQQPRLTRAVARDHLASPSCGSVFAKPDWRDPASNPTGTVQGIHTSRKVSEDRETWQDRTEAKTGTGEQIRIPFTKKALVCWGYMQAMQDLSVLADEDGRMGACPSQRTTLLELIQAFASYARSHELPDNAALAVTRALQEAFPCKARQGFRGPGGAATFDWFAAPRYPAKHMQSVGGG